MPKVISNTSCLIVLDNTGFLHLLQEFYGEILITEEVLQEFGKPALSWVRVHPVQDRTTLRILSGFIDPGEASTIALETDDSLMILDDAKARKIAINAGLPFTGTLGVVLRAKERGIVPSVKTVLEKFKKDGFWISKTLEQHLLKLAGEG